MTITAIIAALAMGFVLGLLGGGGSILAVPILMYLIGLEDKVAIATSLLVVGATGLGAVISHARAGNVDWRTGGIFGGAAMAAAYLGGSFAKLIPGQLLIGGFAAIMLLSATLMLRGGAKVPVAAQPGAEPRVSAAKLLALGGAVGLLSGLVGAGGGFVIVPALVIFGGISMRLAIGTSLAIIALKSFAGFAGYLGHVEIDFLLAGGFAVASVIGTFAGAAVSQRINAARLRTGFAYFVLIAGTLILGEQLESPLILNMILAVVIAAVAFGLRYLGTRRAAKKSVATP
ncbi:sulfite exporter TauE/SafE family protein [Bradymonas sediminis]|uniref:Probable membrane transporter protein n=1 Tax=Bradymonas sediminis TaxID=1548548 RepID=A0A2Z4FNL7_9DELT|nr:sulfite exporter TauE/SafE family protein [Bradymonas sediminis]AWV90375.1 sulfite exporter TauE/SafE family protein [Bradymonas sediminis]TDP72241.1 hypothetical protein DFR33_107225 [Bradymonas sediminis]